MKMKKAVILGTHSFIDAGTKVGSQHLAEGLAKAGWQVDYVATASSPFDVWGPKRHGRLKRVWLQRQDIRGVLVAEGVTEYAFKALFPAHRAVMRAPWQMNCNLWMTPAWFRSRHYDLCIHETSPNVVYWPMASSKRIVFRLNDAPEGFAHDLPSWLIQKFEDFLASNVYDDIWAVSSPLKQYASKANASNNVITIPNGVADAFASQTLGLSRIPRSAVFIGALNHWMDDSLINATAKRLPDWVFDLYGPVSSELRIDAPNVRIHAAVPPSQVPDLLSRYEVGLIPFRDADDRMRFVERPLKFYEYISAGLGIASVDVGALKSGMANLAIYGNTPEEYAKAIVASRAAAQQRPLDFRQNFMMQHSWSAVLQRILERIELLDHTSPRQQRHLP